MWLFLWQSLSYRPSGTAGTFKLKYPADPQCIPGDRKVVAPEKSGALCGGICGDAEVPAACLQHPGR